MDDPIEDADWLGYVRGCERLGWTALAAEAFRSQCHRYVECHRFLQAWETHRAASGGPLVFAQTLVLAPSLRRMRRDRDRLGFLATAVTAGRGDGDENFAAGVPARPQPPSSPVRSEASAIPLA